MDDARDAADDDRRPVQGTTISPYLFFWQASQEVEEQISIGRRRLRHRQGASRFELRYALWDTIAGMVFSEVVAYFIIRATRATLFVAGKTDIGSATDAAQALRPLAGDAAALLLAVGLTHRVWLEAGGLISSESS